MKEYNVSLKSSTDETLFFEVRSSSRDITHDVWFDKDNGWLCTCEQYYYRKRFCKHMRLAREYYRSFLKMMNDNTVYAEIQKR